MNANYEYYCFRLQIYEKFLKQRTILQKIFILNRMKSVAQQQKRHNTSKWTRYFTRLLQFFPSNVFELKLNLVILREINTFNQKTVILFTYDSIFVRKRSQSDITHNKQ